MKRVSIQDWQKIAAKRVAIILVEVKRYPELRKAGPIAQRWDLEVKVVGRLTMIRLNQTYRGKKYPTDVLSFPSISPFWREGVLGDLVVCLSTLKKQAQSFDHSFEVELEILLIHGILHLLGFDHEKNEKQAEEMANWEKKILKRTLETQMELGLIDRSNSGNKKG